MQTLTPMAFRALARARGYTLAQLAHLWGLSRARLTQIANDPQRSAVHDLALWGVPPRRTAAATFAQRVRLAMSLVTPQTARPDQPVGEGAIALYAVYMVVAEQGAHLPEHCRGVVDAIDSRGTDGRVRIQFETGYVEWYTVQYLNDPKCFLAATGASEPPGEGPSLPQLRDT